MATRLLLNGSEFQVNLDSGGGAGNGLLGSQESPDAIALTDGRFVIAYQSYFNGDSSDVDPIARILGGINYLSLNGFTNLQTHPVLAPRNDGGFGTAFTNALHADGTADAEGTNITYRTVTATGVLGPLLAIGDANPGDGTGSLFHPNIATLSTGRQVVVFERSWSANDHAVYLNVVNAAGTGTQFTASSFLTVANFVNVWEANPAVAASGNEALVVYEDTIGTTLGSANIRAALFNGGSNTVGPSFIIADHTAQLRDPEVATLPDNRYVIVYGDLNDLWGRIYDPVTPGGVFLSDEFQVDSPGGSAGLPSVAATADGGFIVTWHSNFDILARRFDAHGVSYGDIFTVNTLNDAQLNPTIATSGSNVVIAWDDYAARATDPNPIGVRAQHFTTTAFDYDSAGIGDLDGNGRVDILFQNDTGNVAVWQTNGNGQVFSINSLGQRPAGYLIDGTGNFNGTPGDDILLRSSGGTLTIWPTAGIAVGAPVVIGNAPNTYHNAGIGDFTGDGQDDLLFRNDAGEIVTWAIANNTLALPPQVLGSTSLAYHIVGIDDFTGDHQSDILFRNDDGTIAVWAVANNQLLSAQAVGSTSTAYHVVSTGDFDGNGAKDILFRGDNGELVEWLLDSTGGLLMAPTSIGTVAAQYHVDGTGDLNGDDRDDIIFRDAGGTVVQWLMNGTTLAAPPAVMGTIAVDYAIAAHHFDVV
jgi:FG-GAP-like repeat